MVFVRGGGGGGGREHRGRMAGSMVFRGGRGGSTEAACQTVWCVCMARNSSGEFWKTSGLMEGAGHKEAAVPQHAAGQQGQLFHTAG